MMYNGLIQFDPERMQELTWHAVEDLRELAYSFEYDGEHYCLLANSIFPFMMDDDETIDTATCVKVANSAQEGVTLAQSQLGMCIEHGVLAMSSLAVFEGHTFLVMHERALFIPLPDSAAQQMYVCFYGANASVEDTMTERLQLTGATNNTGRYVFNAYDDKEIAYERSPYFIETRYDAYGPNIDNPDEKDLFLDDQEVCRDIQTYELYENAVIFKTGDAAYFSAYATGSLLYTQLHKVRMFYCSFQHYGDVYFTLGQSVFSFSCDNVEETSNGYLIDFADFQMEFAFLNSTTVTAHVVGYVLHSESGVEVRWDGECLTQAEVIASGLDSDIEHDSADISTAQDRVAREHADREVQAQERQNAFAERQQPVKDSNVSIKAPQVQNDVTMVASTINIWMNEEPYNFPSVLRDEEVDCLYRLLRD